MNIYLRRGREQRVLGGHPWIFRSDIEREDGAAGGNLFILRQACIQCAYRTNTSQLLMVRLPEATLPSSGVTRIHTRMLHASPPG